MHYSLQYEDTSLPPSVKRKLLDQWHMTHRCDEEIAMVKDEMKGTYEHFCTILKNQVDYLESNSDRPTQYDSGKYSIIITSLIKLECRLKKMYMLFKPHVSIDKPPEEYIPNFPAPIPSDNDTDEELDDNYDVYADYDSLEDSDSDLDV